MALVALIALVAIIIVLYKKKNSSIKSDEPVEPVYYSAVKPVAEEGAPDPTLRRGMISPQKPTKRTTPCQYNLTRPTKQQTSCMLVSLSYDSALIFLLFTMHARVSVVVITCTDFHLNIVSECYNITYIIQNQPSLQYT